MKKLITILLLVFNIILDGYSKNYYLSSSIGNDNNSEVQAQSPETPWETIDKLNNSIDIVAPGDTILFKRGDTFTGTIKFNRSGSINKYIVISAYGSGPNPIISGTLPITQWTNIGGDIWKADCPQLGSVGSSFFIDGIPQQIGRYPNISDPNKGYLTIDSHSGRDEITSSSLESTYDWTGGTAVVRTRHWVIDRVGISTHINNTLSFTNNTSFEIYDDYGFFVQNHLSTLDLNGEWYYDSLEQAMYLYSDVDPNLHATEAAVYNSLFDAISQSFFIIENIKFRGSLNNSIVIRYSDNAIIKNNIICDVGNDAVEMFECEEISFINNRLERINNNGMILQFCRDIKLKSNELHGIGVKPGMGLYSKWQYTGMYVTGNNILFDSNTIDSIGYMGINFHGDSISVKNNLVSHYCLNLDDGAGIYTSGDGTTIYNMRTIEKNIVLNGVGAPEGTSSLDIGSAQGIYLDDRSNHVVVRSNTVANCAGYGIYIHNSNHISLLGNTLYNNIDQLLLVHDNLYPDYPIRNCVVQGNILYAASTSQRSLNIRSIKDDFNEIGFFDFNYYCKPLGDERTILLEFNGGSNFVSELVDLETWNERYNYDQNSKLCPYKFDAFSITDYLDANEFNNGSFNTDITEWSCWSSQGTCNASWDNQGNLDEGCLKLSTIDPSVGSMTAIGNFGDVVENEPYVLKFSMLSSSSNQNASVIMRNGNSPYNSISSNHLIEISNTRNEYEVVFIAGSSESKARIDITVKEDGTTYWIDNIELYRARVEMTEIEDSIWFVYNPTNTHLNFSEEEYYIDVAGNKYHNFSLSPYSSLILKRVSQEYFESNISSDGNILLLVYPNPASFFINLFTNDIGSKSITIIDISGREVYKKSSISESYFSIDISSLSKGLYVIMMEGVGGITTSRFIIP